ncbi:hypothetical protein ABNF97_17180 [Plantactinospora sp. B6F1]|uniref:hypothetical protein n=1 Tax=Plantactinospora sp. B6F1 TaxID=3158971 RepID=UPI0032D8E554
MTGPVPAGPPVLPCRECDGMSFTLVPCRCTYYGDRLLVSEEDRTPGEPYHDCLECDGVGTVGRPCHICRQTGRRRAQFVLTMANLDTGTLASVNVVPGVVEPQRWPADHRTWCLPLAPLLHELAARVGAKSWTEIRRPGPPEEPVVLLPSRWRPDLPPADRELLEAEAIAAQSYDPWWLYLGRTTSEPPRDPAAELARRCRLADLLCLDLVIETRRDRNGTGLSWHLRYEVPDSPVPAEGRGHADDLPSAITGTSELDALYGLEERGRSVPAYRLSCPDLPPAGPASIDLDQLERRILADCVDLRTGEPTAGAQAIWRDGRWRHTSLRVTDTTDNLSESSTGQIHQRRRVLLRRGWQPPAPSWQGEPLPYAECPDCDPDSNLRRCHCRLGAGVAEPDCPACAGTGRSPSALRCHTCRGSRRLHQTVTVTITDLTCRVVHLTWQADPTGWQTGELGWHIAPDTVPGGERSWRTGRRVAAPHVATQPGGKPLHQLPGRFRLAEWAATFGVRPDDLTELDGGGDLDHDLRHGTVTLHRPGDDPLTAHLTTAARGRPGARLFVLARRPDVPSLADLVRLALGLHLTLTVTVVDHVRNTGDLRLVQGERWEVNVGPASGPVTPADRPIRSTPEAAIAFCLDYLGLAIAGTVPDDPVDPIPVPQCPNPIEVADPVPLLRRLARHHAGQPVAVHFTAATCEIVLREPDGVRPLVTAATLPAAIGALGLAPGG